MNPEYITRKTEDFKLIKNTDEKSKLSDFLKEHYNYIIQSMKYEKYKIEYEKYEVLHELLFNDKVVGIMSLVHINSLTQVICINEVYILPEFRNKGIFYETLLNLLNQPNITLAIRNPNNKIINLLIQYNLAKKLENNIIISYVDFIVDDDRIYTNKQIINQYNDHYVKNQVIPTNFYDDNIHSPIFLELTTLNNLKLNDVYIIKARLTDSRNEKYYQMLKNVDNIYLNVLKERIISSTEDMIKFVEYVHENISDYLNINDLLGSDEELTQMFIDKLKENGLTVNDGFKIRKMVEKALKKNEIIPKSIILRALYLMDNFKNPNLQEDIFKIEGACPYCSTVNSDNKEVCVKCGHNLKSKDKSRDVMQFFMENLIKNKLPEEDKLKEEYEFNQNIISQKLRNELEYTDFNEEEVYLIQSLIATYQFLKNIDQPFYFEVYNYDVINNIREGSAFNFAKDLELIEKLRDYCNYVKIFEEYYPEELLLKLVDKYSLKNYSSRDDLIKEIELNVSMEDIFGKKYYINERGRKFLEENSYIENYLDNLSEYSFYEYIKFYKKNKKKSSVQINREFNKYMENIMIRTGNYYKYHSILRNRLNVGVNDHEDYLKHYIIIFIIDINYWIYSKDHRKISKPLSKFFLKDFIEVKRFLLNNDTDYLFNEAYCSVEISYLKNNEELVKFYFQKSLQYDDIDDINREIEYNTYEDEFLRHFM